MTYLYIWMAVAAGGGNWGVYGYHGWVNAGEYSSPAACEKAHRTLGVPDNQYRCVPK